MMDMADPAQPEEIVGWREWLALPELGIPAIKAKIDTGARTSTLHAFRLVIRARPDGDFVRFWIHPMQRRTDVELMCEARLIDQRVIKDSGGHTEERCVIVTPVRLGGQEWPIEITLTSREDMRFRMLLGRTALAAAGLRVIPDASYLRGRKLRNAYARLSRTPPPE